MITSLQRNQVNQKKLAQKKKKEGKKEKVYLSPHTHPNQPNVVSKIYTAALFYSTEQTWKAGLLLR